MPVWMGFRTSVSLRPAIQATGRMALASIKRASAMPIVCPPVRWRFVSIYCHLRSEERLRTTGNLGKDADVCRTPEISGRMQDVCGLKGKFLGEELQTS